MLGRNLQTIKININIPRDLTPPNQKQLNTNQINAVKEALSSNFMMIQGPPGTGKTSTSVGIIYNWLKHHKEQVLVCAPSNNAVDQLAIRLDRCGINVVRLCARSREALSTDVDHISLHILIKNYKNRVFEDLSDKVYRGKKLNTNDRRNYTRLYYKISEEILSRADVICVTCSASFDKRLENFLFKRVLIDDVSLATEPETLLPMLCGAQQVILVGDHCQLGPVAFARSAVRAGYNHSMFERLNKLGVKSLMLNVQYRMHPSISEFSNLIFYGNSIIDGVTDLQRKYYGTKSFWPDLTKPNFFYNVIGSEEQSATGKSYLNREEAKTVEIIVTSLLRANIKSIDIGIITPYQGQKTYIASYLHHKGSLGYKKYEDIEIASVDAFQGKEKDFIIISCVRSNSNSSLGFLSDFRRLNVALTRAKYGVIICGNAGLLSGDKLWNILLNFYHDRNAIFEGSLHDLRQSSIQLPPPDLPYDVKSYFKYAEEEGEALSDVESEEFNIIHETGSDSDS